MDACADLRALLERNAGALGYYEGLSAPLREALRRRESVATVAELQSFVADERESAFDRKGRGVWNT
ncbi:MAG: hypothetical protein IKN96_02270 [Oscillibacter sp.]|nr:hypothetical protein [Oscillibacter sp.]